jgi:Family of unknown function (DUF6491)
MKPKVLSSLGVILISSLLTQTADAKKRDYSERLNLVTQFAGEEIPYVRFGLPRTAHDWEYLGDEAILVWHTRSKAYLVGLEKSSACRDLEHEFAIKLDDRVNDLDTRSGYIDTRYGGWCKINKIRPVNVAALKQARKAKQQGKI